MTKRDLYKADMTLEKARKKIPDWKGLDVNKEHTKKLLQLIQVQPLRKLKYLRHLKKICLWAKFDFSKATREDIAELLKIIDEQGYKAETIKDYRTIIKKTFKVLFGRDEEYPACVRFVKASIPKNKRTKKDHLTKEEADRIVSVANNVRDKAFASALFESCTRPSEFILLQMKDVIPIEHGFQLNIVGKTGSRPIFVFGCSNYLANWLNSHPDKDNEDAYLWVQVSTNRYGKPLSLPGARALIKVLAKRAGITRSTTLYMSRRGGITHKRATLRVSARALENYAGWEPGSRQVRVYDQSTGFACKDEIMEKMGLEVPKYEPAKSCFRCKSRLSNGEQYCATCGSPTSEKAVHNSVYTRIIDTASKHPEFQDVVRQAILEQFEKLGPELLSMVEKGWIKK